MMKKVFLVVIMLMCVSLKSQERDSIIYIPSGQSSEVDSIKLEIVKYLMDNKQIKPEENLLKLYDSKVYTTSLIDNKILEFKKKGIFRVVITTSHAPRYLLLVDENIKIIDYKDLSQTLNEVIEFLKKHNESDKDIAEYIQAVLNDYKMDMERIKIKK